MSTQPTSGHLLRRGLRAPRFKLGLVILALLAGPTLGNLPSGRLPRPDLNFARAREAQGLEYRQARDALLAAGPAAADLLRERAAAPEATENEKWLSHILLERAASPAEFAKIEAEFARIVWLAEFGGPSFNAAGHVAKGRLSFPEAEPIKQPGMMGIFPPAEVPHAKSLEAFARKLTHPASPAWGALLGEVLLKGWTATEFRESPRMPLS